MRALIGLWQFQRGWLRDLCPAVVAVAFSMSASPLEPALVVSLDRSTAPSGASTHVCALRGRSAVTEHNSREKGSATMIVIGIDSYKDTLAGCLIDTGQGTLEHREIPNTAEGHEELTGWAVTSGAHKVGMEGSSKYGRPASVVLGAAGVTVVEAVPADDNGSQTRSADPQQNRQNRRAGDRPDSRA